MWKQAAAERLLRSVCMHTYAFICVYTQRIKVYIYIYQCTNMFIYSEYTCIFMHTHVYVLCIFVFTSYWHWEHVHIFIFVYICIFTYAHMYMYLHFFFVYIHLYIKICIHLLIYSVYTYIPTHTFVCKYLVYFVCTHFLQWQREHVLCVMSTRKPVSCMHSLIYVVCTYIFSHQFWIYITQICLYIILTWRTHSVADVNTRSYCTSVSQFLVTCVCMCLSV